MRGKERYLESRRGRDPLLERAVRAFVPIDSFTQDPVKREEVDTPEVGARWGEPAAFSFMDPATEVDPDSGTSTGMRIIFDLGVEEIVRVTDITPVFYEYEILRVKKKDDPDVYIDATAATRLLIPVSSGTRDIRIGYTIGPSGIVPVFEQRQIETYAWITLPSILDADGYDSGHITRIGTGSAGVFPTGPSEMDYGMKYAMRGYPIDSFFASFNAPSPLVFWS